MNWERRKQSEDWARRMAYEFDKANSHLTFAEFCYQQGKADGVREFAEWLLNSPYMLDIGFSKPFVVIDEKTETYTKKHFEQKLVSLDEVIAEYEKEQKE